MQKERKTWEDRGLREQEWLRGEEGEELVTAEWLRGTEGDRGAGDEREGQGRKLRNRKILGTTTTTTTTRVAIVIIIRIALQLKCRGE